MKIFKISIILLIVVLGTVQFISCKLPKNEAVTSNDLIASGFADNTIGNILKTSCYDCHSQQTVYPWYSHVAPVSWLIAKDVREGREELDFSRWNQYSKREMIGKMDEIMEQVEQNKMPLKITWFYIRQQNWTVLKKAFD